jgi:hypothetical protein
MATETQFITCTRCGNPKLFTEFHCDKTKQNGRRSWCRQCVQKYNRDAMRAKRELKRTWGVVARLSGKAYTAVFIDPYGFTPEATRAGIKMVKR